MKKSEVRVAAHTINSADPRLFPDGTAITHVVAGALYKECGCTLARSLELGREFSAMLDKVHGDRSEFAPNSKLVRALLKSSD